MYQLAQVPMLLTSSDNFDSSYTHGQADWLEEHFHMSRTAGKVFASAAGPQVAPPHPRKL